MHLHFAILGPHVRKGVQDVTEMICRYFLRLMVSAIDRPLDLRSAMMIVLFLGSLYEPIDIVCHSSETFFGGHIETWIFEKEK